MLAWISAITDLILAAAIAFNTKSINIQRRMIKKIRRSDGVGMFQISTQEEWGRESDDR